MLSPEEMAYLQEKQRYVEKNIGKGLPVSF